MLFAPFRFDLENGHLFVLRNKRVGVSPPHKKSKQYLVRFHFGSPRTTICHRGSHSENSRRHSMMFCSPFFAAANTVFAANKSFGPKVFLICLILVVPIQVKPCSPLSHVHTAASSKRKKEKKNSGYLWKESCCGFTFRDLVEYLDHVVSITNMKCLTPQKTLQGKSEFLAANLFARSIFRKFSHYQVKV